MITRLTTERVGRRFGRRWLFRNVAFELSAGESLAVTGPNGSGKSTLLRILARLLQPTEGEVRLEIDGQAVDQERHPLRTGFVAPYLNVYDGFSARENLDFIASARRMPDRAARIGAVLEQVQLADRADDRVATYSSGMKVRVKYAAALLAYPPLLLLDEPTTNLDARGVGMVRDVMQQHLDRGGLLIVATNNADEARWCARELPVAVP
ncbi:MAG: heme ABC exporter ATP-binding protein CcmA [Rhodothermales bacterium]